MPFEQYKQINEIYFSVLQVWYAILIYFIIWYTGNLVKWASPSLFDFTIQDK